MDSISVAARNTIAHDTAWWTYRSASTLYHTFIHRMAIRQGDKHLVGLPVFRETRGTCIQRGSANAHEKRRTGALRLLRASPTRHPFPHLPNPKHLVRATDPSRFAQPPGFRSRNQQPTLRATSWHLLPYSHQSVAQSTERQSERPIPISTRDQSKKSAVAVLA